MIGRSAVLTIFLAGLAGLAFVCGAAAGQYNCEVPVAVLCQGCATDVTIALQARGRCRVSFNPAPDLCSRETHGCRPSPDFDADRIEAASFSTPDRIRQPRWYNAAIVEGSVLCIQRAAVL